MRSPEWLKPGLWGAATGAVAMAAVGFWLLGWVTSTTAEELAQARSETAVVAALVPFCVDKAQQDPDNKIVLAKLQAERSAFSRSDLVMRAGWATVGSQKSPDMDLAHACSDQLNSLKSG
jgi:hypothetical protein